MNNFLTWGEVNKYLEETFGITNKSKEHFTLWELKVYLESAFKNIGKDVKDRENALTNEDE